MSLHNAYRKHKVSFYLLKNLKKIYISSIICEISLDCKQLNFNELKMLSHGILVNKAI